MRIGLQFHILEAPDMQWIFVETKFSTHLNDVVQRGPVGLLGLQNLNNIRFTSLSDFL